MCGGFSFHLKKTFPFSIVNHQFYPGKAAVSENLCASNCDVGIEELPSEKVASRTSMVILCAKYVTVEISSDFPGNVRNNHILECGPRPGFFQVTEGVKR